MFEIVLNIPLDFLSYVAMVLRERDTRDYLIYAKLIVVYSPYSEVIHGSTTFKLTKS